jgi:natural product biosynthesis luciferase-like monooxygenase protein
MKEIIDAKKIETLLMQHPAVEKALVIDDGEEPSSETRRRVAYVQPARSASRKVHTRELKFSLFYFADTNSGPTSDKYQLYLKGATFADEHDFEAVWTPERHFHENGGLYPNPSVLSAALATITKRVKLRAGSVALPLHHPLRVAEEWSVVDNLSNGRVGVSFASGWIPNDFAIAPQPDSFPNKREVMLRDIGQVQQLWQGKTVPVRDGVGNNVEVRIFPEPIQPQLPIWLTCSGGRAMFEKAGELGLNVLTALLTQSLEEVAEKIALYRQARARHGHDPEAGQVTLMLHTFVEEDEQKVREKVRQPLTDYLKSHISLIETMVKSLNIEIGEIDRNDPRWLDLITSFAFERYYQTASLIGTGSKCLEMVNRLKEMSVDEVACLIDFGVDVPSVLKSLHHLKRLKETSDAAGGPNQRLLGRFLKERLSEDIGPISFVVLDHLPLTADGQIDWEALPQAQSPAEAKDSSGALRRQVGAPPDASVPPPAALEQTLADRMKRQILAQERQRQLMRKQRGNL